MVVIYLIIQHKALMQKCVVIQENYDRAKKILTDNMDKLHMMAEALVKFETLDTKQIQSVMAGKMPKKTPAPKANKPTRVTKKSPSAEEDI